MAYYYVYSPFSGTLWGQDCYCGSCSDSTPCNSGGFCTSCGSNQTACTHNTGITGLCCPIDIGGAANTALKLYVSSNISSIVTTRTGPSDDGDALCATTPPSGFAWVNEGVKVTLYCQAAIIGTVFFGHLRNRISNGEYFSPNGKIIGYLGDQDCNCSCYHGIHTHIERSSTNGYTYHRNCNTSLTTATSIYRFTGPDNCAV